MSANDYLTERLTRHQIFVQRFGGSEVNKMLPFLRSILNEIRASLSGDLTPFGRNRLVGIESSIARIVTEGMEGIEASLTSDLIEFAEYEGEFMARLLDSSVSVEALSVTPEQIRSAITTKPMQLIKGKQVQSLTMQSAFRQFSGTVSRDVRRVVQMGIVEGKTTQQMIVDITRLISNRTSNQAEALVRTVTNHAATVARNITAEENADILDGERFVATLDNRVTTTCAGFDGKKFDVGQGPHPALHWNCRSTRAPVLRQEFAALQMEGERPSKGDDGKNVVSGKVTYGGFLKRQSDEFQNKVLGPERAKLFRSGKVSIEKFTNDRGIPYSLDELRQDDASLTLQ